MFKRLFLPLVFLSVTATCLAQSAKTGSVSMPELPILDCGSNTKWLDSLKTLQLPEQLRKIRHRVISDTNVHIYRPQPDGLHIDSSLYKNRLAGCCKLLWVWGGYVITFDELNPKLDVETFLNTIDKVHIDEITVFNGDDKIITKRYSRLKNK